MNIAKYLTRIGMDKTGVVADIAGLKMLQRQHLLNVPFENLDIHWGSPITMEIAAFYTKVVDENRGGFCYELNGLFNELLRELGFETRLLSARVADGHGNFSPEFDHAAILVMIGEMHYLADVGFGEFTAEPLQFMPDVEQADQMGTFVILKHGPEYFEVTKQVDSGWKSEYIFKPLGHHISEFEERCLWHQTSPESHFTKGKVCSIMTLTGRKTLTDKELIFTDGDRRTGTRIETEDEFERVLFGEFGIAKPAGTTAYSLVDQIIQ